MDIFAHFQEQTLFPRGGFPGFNNSDVEKQSGQSAGQFAATLSTGLILFGIQTFAFLLLKDRFARIYQPRTYLVPPRERTAPAEPGWFLWIKSVLNTSNSEFVQRCGLDAYFFLRYLRTLLKIFIPAACVILPVLLPINAVGGRGADWALDHGTLTEPQSNVTGLNTLAWGNVQPSRYRRYWAHWSMAVLLVIWICYVAFDELRNYIRMRQAYVTSPQHRLRASATTVLVSSIPEKWCTVEALDGLYDVFPGGLRNIWINRNFDELSDKVQRRDKLAAMLESAETELVKKCYKKNEENIQRAEKKAGTTLSKEDKRNSDKVKDEKGRQQAEGAGVSTNNPHQVKHTIHDALAKNQDNPSSEDEHHDGEDNNGPKVPIPIIGGGVQAVGEGLSKVGQGILGGLRGAGKGLNNTIDNTNGFIVDETDTGRRPVSSDAARLFKHQTANMRAYREPSPRSMEFDSNAETPRIPHSFDNDQRPLAAASPVSQTTAGQNDLGLAQTERTQSAIDYRTEEAGDDIPYPAAFREEFEKDDNDAVWRRYLDEKDRDTHRLPIFGWNWMTPLPLIGQKVDTIYYCRKEVARLNVEIEEDQAHPERFPLLNSAFIQFNHQVAAHMACQSLSHHLPKQMDPRIVEIDPNDVIWDNMSIPWWQNYIRTALVITTVCGMIVLWAIPIAITSALSQLSTLAHQYTWLSWILKLPSWFISFLQGVLPIAMLGLLMFLLPLILRYLAKLQGIQSDMLVELSVQKYYFFFIFVQLFLVVTVGSAISQLAKAFTSVEGISNIPQLLGQTLPTASNYFFSYMLLQGLSVSSGALLQTGSLVAWFILAPILDSTARAKFNRQTSLQNVQWGTFFPVYTNLACIGLIYAVVSPLILVFDIIAFSLFWFVYRYNTLYVTRFTKDTGGLLFPGAINLTFVGVYVMELSLVGLFFLIRDQNNDVVGVPQAVSMIVIMILTGIYQILLNNAFSPLFRYLPITLEDDAVQRDEAFAREMRSKHEQHNKLIGEERDDEDIEDQLEAHERVSLDDDQREHDIEMERIDGDKQRRADQTAADDEHASYVFQNPEINLDADSRGIAVTKKLAKKTADAVHLPVPNVVSRNLPTRRTKSSWADRDNTRNRRSSYYGQSYNQSQNQSWEGSNQLDSTDNVQKSSRQTHNRGISDPKAALQAINDFNPLTGNAADLEAQRAARNQLADALYAGVSNELEDLSPDQRDALVQRAFQHSALRARRPVIWLPRDDLGVSDDEIRRMGKFSRSLWVSNVRQGLDSKGRTVYSGAPPDFSEVDLIQL